MEIQRVGHPSIRGSSGDDAVRDKAAIRDTPGSRPKRAEPATAMPEQPAGTLEISERARELARLQEAVAEAPEVRTEKVAEIKRRIEDGTYSVSPDVLAARLLGES